ncbi:putative SKP1/BTB/POZ domain-containing protein [Rosa chinensis]|uniref:Putative SKP1/BTB/POZ domain-containing protein n=1 Tax=Rosa chinensis TaxID=74649 RepID=A0A2P6QEU7_ROSCH|nr:putative SKP1/BTB/POZ domain-containing protein [Rosa chinensis]PRQ53560.1 putative SKP1/BTB/POZ domain-containing protein [Rosa chinensis]
MWDAIAFGYINVSRFFTTGLPSDVVVEVGEMSFHLHNFLLLSRSRVMES